MQLLGQPVRHNAFGTGVITGLSGNIITIDFAQGEKRFQYPDAFSRFLTLKDAGKQNEIRAGYERRLRAERAERQKELERQERLGKIRSMKVTPYSQAAFDIVPFPVSWTVKMKKKQKETQDILSYHTQAAGCSDKARAKASGGRQPIEECGRTGL